MFQLLQYLGLLPRKSVICLRPDRGMIKMETKPKRVSAKQEEPTSGIRWGDRRGVQGVYTENESGATWSTLAPLVSTITADLWTLYDEQEFTREQTGRTRSFTKSEYLTLRSKYWKDEKMTNAQAGELYGFKASWGKNRMQAVRRAVKKMNRDIKENRAFPLPHRPNDRGVV